MLDCQVAKQEQHQQQQSSTDQTHTEKEERPKRRTKFIGITKHIQQERQRQAERIGPDPWPVRKFAVGLVIAIFFYTYYVFVVRVAVRMVRMESDRLGNRAQGVVYLVLFHILFIMFIWSYTKAITTTPGFARDVSPFQSIPRELTPLTNLPLLPTQFVAQSEPPKENVQLVDVVGYRFEDQPVSPRRHTSTEDLRRSSETNWEDQQQRQEQIPRESLTTTEEGTITSGGGDHPLLPSSTSTAAEDEIAAEHPTIGSFIPPFPIVQPPSPSQPHTISTTTTTPLSRTPSVNSPTTESFTTSLSPSSNPLSPSNLSGHTAVSSSSTFPLSYPPKAHPKHGKGKALSSDNPRPSLSNSLRSFMNFPEPAEDYEANRKLKEAVLVERVPPQVPVLSEDYRYDEKEGFLRPYRSHRFYNFLQWSTAFTLFIFISLVLSITLPLHSPPRPHPSLDGELIAIISISGFFSFFTGALFVAHTRLILLNMTTIEEMGMARIRARERAALSRVYGFLGWKQKRATKKSWNEEWGRLGREGNLWWLGSRRANWVMVMGENKLGWFLPIPASPTPDDGLSYVPNPRFSKDGLWRPRKEWPRELQ
ncbi:hypothetical protein P7C70_g1218, partial [Phenoliferia sp. Uapishka_3]